MEKIQQYTSLIQAKIKGGILMNMLVQQYQSRVLGPTEPVMYSEIIKQAYPPQALHQEPFVGFKVLCTDTNAYGTNPAERIRYIDSGLGFLKGRGCIIRETSIQKPDGFWVITLPVPRSQITQALNNLMNVLTTFEQYFGIVRDGLFEINVSGKCHINDTERCLSGLTIPQRYLTFVVTPENTPYRLGHIVRINDQFMVLRTRWDLSKTNSPATHYEDLTVIAQLIASMYH